jgi:hypothetical protein
MILGLMITVRTFGDAGGSNVTVRLDNIRVAGTRTNLYFECNVRINNQSGLSLTATNLFFGSPGLALKVSGLDGKELKRTYAWPWKAWEYTLLAGEQEYKGLWYGARSGRGGAVSGISLPETAKIVRLQIEGTLSGSSYTNSIASNVVEVRIP